MITLALARLQAEYDALKGKCNLASTDLEYQTSLHQQISAVLTKANDEEMCTFNLTKLNNSGILPVLKDSYSSSINMTLSPMSPGVLSHSNSSALDHKMFGNHMTSRAKSISINPSQNNSIYKEGMMPTQNLKLEHFMEIICGSLMTKDEIKEKTKAFFMVLETSYTEKIKSLNFTIEK